MRKMRNQLLTSPVLAVLVVMGSPTFAKVGADEAVKRGKELTPIGAEKTGNKASTITVWIPQSQVAYKKGEHLSDSTQENVTRADPVPRRAGGEHAAGTDLSHRLRPLLRDRDG